MESIRGVDRRVSNKGKESLKDILNDYMQETNVARLLNQFKCVRVEGNECPVTEALTWMHDVLLVVYEEDLNYLLDIFKENLVKAEDKEENDLYITGTLFDLEDEDLEYILADIKYTADSISIYGALLKMLRGINQQQDDYKAYKGELTPELFEEFENRLEDNIVYFIEHKDKTNRLKEVDDTPAGFYI
jgi:hypothetical protein